MSRFLLAPIVVLAAFVACAARADANDIKYTITDLGTLGGPTSRPTGINNLGEVVGTADLTTRYGQAFAYSGTGPMIGLGSFAGPYSVSYAEAVNDSGTVVGFSDSTTSTLAFVYTPSGGMQPLPSFGGSFAAADSINNAGQVAGNSLDVNGTIHGFLWSPNSPMLDLGQHHAVLVNNSSLVIAVTGSSPNQQTFISNGGTSTWTDIGTFGGSETFPNGVNDRGDVVGYSTTDISGTMQRAFLYSGGTMTDLGSFGSTATSAQGINDDGVVVGYSFLADGTDAHGFIYYGSGPIVDLNSLIDPTLGWTVGFAADINDRGQIAAWGRQNGGPGQALLLTPVPEPRCLQIVFAAAACLTLAGSARRLFAHCRLHLSSPIRTKFNSPIRRQ